MTRDRREAGLMEYWFGNDLDDRRVAQRQAPLWFEHHLEHDREIIERFGGLLDAAERGALDSWRGRGRAHLALVVVLDQLSRVIGRGTPRAFQNDAHAMRISRELLDTDVETALRPVERVFLYLPLEHSEDLVAQEEAVARCEALVREVPAPWRSAFENFAAYARRHADVIRRFGRFPHRNEILQRISTTEESEFLRNPDASF